MLRKTFFHLILFLLPFGCLAQFYMKGKITDEKNAILANVKMRLLSNGMLYANGSSGEFGLPSSKKADTVFCFVQGYDSLKTVVKNGQYNTIVLKPNSFTKEDKKAYLSSLTPYLARDASYIHYIFAESYSNMVENSFVETARFPITGFSLNVNKASYSNIRRFINNHTIMPTDGVRIEEMLNYFPLNFAPKPNGDEVFGIKSQISTCPWNSENLLLFIAAQAQKVDLDKVPPSNLVFLIDNSGSMDMPNRLPLLKAGFKMLANNLRSIDTVTIVTYGGAASVLLPPTSGKEKEKIDEAIEGLEAAGDTPGASGLKLAYQMAQNKYIKNGNNRVILATDGDFNVGQTNEKELEYLIKDYKKSGIYLTCLGVGMGNYKDSKLETLARYGNGNFAYLDNESEAEKVLSKEFAQTVLTVASDVSLNLHFDPIWVKQYRLIGFDNRQDAVTDSTCQLEGGEIGSGHCIMAMVEIIPNKTMESWQSNIQSAIGNIELKYKLPTKKQFQQKEQQLFTSNLPFDSLCSSLRFATSVAMFGTLVKQSHFATTSDFDKTYAIASAAIEKDNLLQQEFLTLVLKAKELYTPKSIRKRKKD